MQIHTYTLWEFANDLYRRPKVESACLQLQSAHDLDVCLLLFCHWAGATRGLISTSILAQATRLAQSWNQHVVIPIRDARTWTKSVGAEFPQPIGEFREDLKRVELEAERVQLQALESMVKIPVMDLSDVSGLKNSITNLNNMLIAGNKSVSGEALGSLGDILSATWPGLSVETILEFLTGIKL